MSVPRVARADWADIAKAASIVGVVLLHVTGEFSREICGTRNTAQCTGWGEVNAALTPLRVPLFFAISGYFARSALARPWRQVIGPRVVNNLYVYFLWTVLGLGLLLWWDAITERQLSAGLHRSWLGYGDYWYVFALAVFFPVTKLLGRLPGWLMVGVALAIGYLTPWLWEMSAGDEELDKRVWRLTFYFVYFVIGARLGPLLARAAEAGARSWIFVAALVTLGVLDAVNLSLEGRWLRPVVSVLAVFAGAVIASWLSRFRAMRGFGRLVGHRTLGVYLLQGLLVSLLMPLMIDRLDPSPVGSQVVWLGLIPAMTIAVVALSLLVYDVTSRFGLRLLYRLPGVDRWGRRGALDQSLEEPVTPSPTPR
jgi:uncharacterized membrane protein YcfT